MEEGRMEKATGESSLVPPEERAEDEDDHDDEDDWADAKQIPGTEPSLRRFPGTSCLATISLSLRDKAILHQVSVNISLASE